MINWADVTVEDMEGMFTATLGKIIADPDDMLKQYITVKDGKIETFEYVHTPEIDGEDADPANIDWTGFEAAYTAAMEAGN